MVGWEKGWVWQKTLTRFAENLPEQEYEVPGIKEWATFFSTQV